VSTKILKEQKGFTLLELLIVIVIIAILALLIIPNITSAPKKARDTQRKTDLTTIRKGLEEYFVNNNKYPTAAQGLAELTAASTGPIMKAVPTDPKNTGSLVYTYTPANTETTYDLWGCLENPGDNGANVTTDATACPAPSGGKKFTLTNAN
jgi:general secretion pathway protein G